MGEEPQDPTKDRELENLSSSSRPLALVLSLRSSVPRLERNREGHGPRRRGNELALIVGSVPVSVWRHSHYFILSLGALQDR